MRPAFALVFLAVTLALRLLFGKCGDITEYCRYVGKSDVEAPYSIDQFGRRAFIRCANVLRGLLNKKKTLRGWHYVSIVLLPVQDYFSRAWRSFSNEK